MRCLTLADALASRGAHCAFVARDLPENLVGLVHRRGHSIYLLKLAKPAVARSFTLPASDAAETAVILSEFQPDWVVVDHYGIDATWERSVARDRPVLVLDDLNDRPHAATVLVNQNLVPAKAYDGLVPRDCRLLVGPTYAILRPEFAQARTISQPRRTLSRLIISMGGSDPDGASARVLEHLDGRITEFGISSISIVLGPTAESEITVRRLAARMPVATDVFVGVSDIARRMAEADLAIGGGGTTSWERCCVGLPSVVLSLAANQEQLAATLDDAGVAIHAGSLHDRHWRKRLADALTHLALEPAALGRMSRAAYTLTDGAGVNRICSIVLNDRTDDTRSSQTND